MAATWVDKALVGLLRRQSVRANIGRHLRARGLAGVAQMLDALAVPSFATWRWATLAECTDRLGGVLETLAAQWDPAFLEGARDSGSVLEATAGLCSAEWRLRFGFVRWLAGWLNDISSWVGGCACHSASVWRPGETFSELRKTGRCLMRERGVLDIVYAACTCRRHCYGAPFACGVLTSLASDPHVIKSRAQAGPVCLSG